MGHFNLIFRQIFSDILQDIIRQNPATICIQGLTKTRPDLINDWSLTKWDPFSFFVKGLDGKLRQRRLTAKQAAYCRVYKTKSLEVISVTYYSC